MALPADEAAAEKAARYLNMLRAERAQHSSGTGPSADSGFADEPVPPRQERRRYARYTCSGSVQLRKEWSSVSTWGTFTDISLGGCYVEMQATFPPETRLDLILELEGIRVHSKAVVRVTYPFLGMGLAFTEMSKEDNKHLREMISRLAGPPQPSGPPPTQEISKSAVDASLPIISDPIAAVDALAKYFKENTHLSRETFFELLRRSQSISSTE
jgi:hypothetical protein